MKCVKVLKKEADKTKKELIKMESLSRDYRPFVGKTYIYFPINKHIHGYTLINKECQKINRIKLDISSFDQIGDIVILPEDTKKSDAFNILKRKEVKVVLKKKGIHKGEFRTQDLDYFAGEKRKETIYKENGVAMKLNVETSYFSPRLSTERKRIAGLVKKGENILVLFSGIGPYPLVLAKHSEAKLIVGVEKNPEAHKYALENCKKYKQIELYNMDAKKFTYKEQFDRILMPLPKSAENFLNIAIKLLKKKGTIHFYDMAHEKDMPDSSLNKIKPYIKKFKLLSVTKCGDYAPGKYRICLDLEVSQLPTGAELRGMSL